ncbi:MAG: alpha-amylase family glycosyl hydrolase [Saprospiraceae bacterium]
MTKWFMLVISSTVLSCGTSIQKNDTVIQSPFVWENATVYFLLTDRFNNGDTTNDFVHPAPPAPYRGYMGGDIKGITQKIEDGYFDRLGVNAIWMTPLIENVQLGTDEGTGLSYGFHGYWAKDWSKIDPRIGTEKDVSEMVAAAHKKGIRVIMDAVINHTGPVTLEDTQWPDDWVRTEPTCTYQSYATTTACTLVKNLPDILTESTKDVNLPPHLIEKWKNEGRYEQELAELDVFFKGTGYPRRPYFYIIKWLTDFISDYGIDGFRVDTAKHTEEEVWAKLNEESQKAFAAWKKTHASETMNDQSFFMVGEVYNYFVKDGRDFNFGDKKVDYFNHGFHALINFDFKYDATRPFRDIFQKYDTLLHGPLYGKSVMNYISSHDDGAPFDKERKMTKEAGTKLLLTQGMAQIYYGDESARSLSVKADGDATLRSFMNWEEQSSDSNKKEVLVHWQKLGKFRQNHLSIGAGKNHMINDLTFARTYESDTTVIALEQPIGKKTIQIEKYFAEGTKVTDHYSGTTCKVSGGKIDLDSPFDIVLLAK